MTINEYQKEAMRSANPQSLNDQAKGLSNTALGLCGESGEVADMIKKHLHQGHDLDKEHMVKELGDVAWYLALGATIIGYDLEDILQMNIDKLRTRYPEGFDARRSADADDERFHKLLNTIFTICELSGFHLEERIILKDIQTGKVWR